LVLGSLLVLTGCSAAIPLPTHVDGDGGIGFGGTLGGDPPCLWLEYEGGGRSVVIWPAGFSARQDPLRVVAPDGRVIATAGDVIEGGGDPDRGGPVTGCAISDSVLLTEISSVNGRRVMYPTPGPPHPTRPVEPR
jgi:hypothetical protein